MEKITDLSNFRNKKMLMDEAEQLVDYIFEQAKQGAAVHKVEQDIFTKILSMGHQALGHFIVLQGDGDMGDKIELSSRRTVKRLSKLQKRVYRSIFGLYDLERVVYGTR